MKKEPQIFTRTNNQGVPVSADILDMLEQEALSESIIRKQLRQYIKQVLLEWEPANEKNLMLDREGMEKSDRENVSKYLKSLGLL